MNHLDLDASIDENFEKPLIESMTIEPDIGSRMNQSTNPWNVSDASVFLKYCCPECDYINLNLSEFSDHALENHAQSIALFDPTDNQGYKNRYNLVDCDIRKNDLLKYFEKRSDYTAHCCLIKGRLKVG